jgi:hypothetical protein
MGLDLPPHLPLTTALLAIFPKKQQLISTPLLSDARFHTSHSTSATSGLVYLNIFNHFPSIVETH